MDDIDNLAQSTPRENWNGFWIWPEDTDVERNVYSLFRGKFFDLDIKNFWGCFS